MDAPITSFADAPFHCPPDVVLDLPVPPSVNKTRRLDDAGRALTAKWRTLAHGVLMAAGFRRQPTRIPRFGLWITVSESHTEQDLDNPLKNLIDYLRLIEVIENDAKRNMREIHVVWGDAPEGIRVTVRPCA